MTHSANKLIGVMLPIEGITLQQAHLMVNYDLPWSLNRLEWRLGRIQGLSFPREREPHQ